MMTNIVGCDPDAVVIGMPVRAVFERRRRKRGDRRSPLRAGLNGSTTASTPFACTMALTRGDVAPIGGHVPTAVSMGRVWLVPKVTVMPLGVAIEVEDGESISTLPWTPGTSGRPSRRGLVSHLLHAEGTRRSPNSRTSRPCATRFPSALRRSGRVRPAGRLPRLRGEQLHHRVGVLHRRWTLVRGPAGLNTDLAERSRASRRHASDSGVGGDDVEHLPNQTNKEYSMPYTLDELSSLAEIRNLRHATAEAPTGRTPTSCAACTGRTRRMITASSAVTARRTSTG